MSIVISRKDEGRPPDYGWWIVAVAFLAIVFAFGVPTVILPVLYSSIIDEFGWTRTQVTLVATMKVGAGAAWGIVLGFLIDRVSIRTIVVSSSVITGGAMIAFLGIRTLWLFYAIGLVLGLGSLGVMISMKVLVSRWFERRQGVAVGIALLGTSVAGSFAPVLASRLIDLAGWRFSMALLSLGIWLVALPVFVWKAKDAPVSAAATDTTPFRLILLGPTFWWVALAVVLIGFVDQAMTQHTVLYLERDLGLRRSAASSALSFVFFTSIAGKLGFGWIYDRWSLRGVSACYFLMALSVVFMFSIQSAVSLLVFAAVRGLAHGGAIVDIPVLSRHCFGPRVLGRTIGILTAFVTIGFATGPPIMGYLYDVHGSYRIAFFVLVAASIAAGLSLFAARATYRDERLRLSADTVEGRLTEAASEKA
ncbi:MAG TPA: MFS transporter [Vicinamibacteria bacterium]|nr:MFS transporter [Vicinamibacteria bacterium]